LKYFENTAINILRLYLT